MNARHTVEKTNRRRGRWPWIAGAAVLVAAALLTARWFFLQEELKAELAAVREMGQPITVEELSDWYPSVHDDENAAPLYLRGAEHFTKPRVDPTEVEYFSMMPLFGSANFPSAAQAFEERALSIMKRHVEDNRRTLELIHEAREYPSSRYPVDFTQGRAVSVAHLHSLRNLWKLVAAEATLAVEAGDGDAAIESIGAGLAIAESLESEPIFVSQLVRYRALERMVDITRRLVHRCALTDTQLAGLEAVFANLSVEGSVKRGLIGERCVTFQSAGELTFRPMGPGMAPPIFSGVPKGDVLGSLLFEQLPIIGGGVRRVFELFGLDTVNRLNYLQFAGEIIEAHDLPYSQGDLVLGQIESRLEKLPAATSALTQVTLPNFSRLRWNEAETESRLILARIMIAVERFRIEHGRIPLDLEELRPSYLESVPEDPFDGKPIRYVPRKGRYRIYTVNGDLMDDGGFSSPRPYEAGTDIVLDVVLPKTAQKASHGVNPN